VSDTLLRHALAARRQKTPWFARFHYAPLWGYFAVCGFLIFTIDIPLDESEELMLWELRFLALPLALIVFGLAYRHRIFLRLHATKKRKMSVVGLAIIFYLFALLSGFAWTLLLNTSGGSPVPVMLHGRIVQMSESHSGKGIPAWTLVVDEEAQHQQRRFAVSRSMYNAAYVGKFYRTTMRIGWMGVLYRWNWQTPGPALSSNDTP
jgi:hypothetical protein